MNNYYIHHDYFHQIILQNSFDLNNNFKRESREIGTKLKLQNNIKFSIFEFPIGTECQIVGFDGKGYHVSFSGRLVRISFRMFNYFFQP